MKAFRITNMLAMLTLAVTMTSVGCALPSIAIPGGSLTEPTKPDPQANFNNTPHYRVSLYTESAKPQQSTHQLTGRMFASQVLSESDALRQFTKPRVFLMRTSESGERHRMEMDYNPSRRSVHHAFDYSIRNGDHIIVTEDHTQQDSGSLLGRLMPSF